MDETQAKRKLSEIPPGAHISQLYDVLQQLVPLDACVVQRFHAKTPHNIVFASYKLHNSVADAWLLDGENHHAMTLAPLKRAKPGDLINDRQMTPRRVSDKIKVYGAMDHEGLHQRSALILPTRTIAGVTEHCFIALLSRSRSPIPTRKERLLRSLHAEIASAVERIILPPSVMGSGFMQFIRAQRIGYACLDQHGTIMLSNTRAHQLAARYSRQSSATSFSALEQLVRDTRVHYQSTKKEVGASAMQRYCESRYKALFASILDLTRSAHNLARDVALVMLQETEWDPDRQIPEFLRHTNLTAREQEVAALLYNSNWKAVELGAQLGISPRTVETHTFSVYRKLGVRSRKELSDLLNQKKNRNRSSASGEE